MWAMCRFVFDVMSLIDFDNAHATIRHYINAFGAESL